MRPSFLSQEPQKELTSSRTPKTRNKKVLGPQNGGLAPLVVIESAAYLSPGPEAALSPLPQAVRECSSSHPPGHQAPVSQGLPLSLYTALCRFCVNARSVTCFHISWYYTISTEFIENTVLSAQAGKLGSGSAFKAFPDLGPS